MKIHSRYDQTKVLWEDESKSMLETVMNAVKAKANLCGADLRGANLRGADLRGADLRGAYLCGAYLCGANLCDAYLRGAKINWQSHALIAELLLRAAGEDVGRRKVAGLVAVSTDWCWDDFLHNLPDDDQDWALPVLAEYVTDGDDAPECVVRHVVKTEEQDDGR